MTDLTHNNAKHSTGVLESAEFIVNNSKDVFVSNNNCSKAANIVYSSMQKKKYSTETWSSHLLTPKDKSQATVDWIFVADTLNFSFWSDYDDSDTGLPESQRYTVEYKGEQYTGYWSLCAAINKALDAGIKITSPVFWASQEFTVDVLRHVFRSETKEQIPLLEKRFQVLKEAGEVITKVSDFF